ncbi:MAG: GntR family transcriptional regulator [Hyphomicrobiaceae bacterium]
MSAINAKAERRPLYVQVRAVILERIENGTWKPGALLPSEIALGRELGVSQGTVRKGLDSLVQDQLLVRRQGSGTFVADHTPADVLFRFFKIYTQSGERVLPSSQDVRIRRGKATKREAGILKTATDAEIIRISRTRLTARRPIIREMIAVSAAMFPDLGADGSVPNTLYDLFQHQYGVTVSHAQERIEAIAAPARDARYLGLQAGAPLLKVDRLTLGLGNRPIEWRVSLCHLKGLQYIVELR